MRILIDGDACPQKEEILLTAKKYHKEVILFIDYAHEANCESYDEVIYCDIGSDSADMQILNKVQANDLVITQDYGLSALVLSKKAIVLHVSGNIIDENNIDGLLFRRYKGVKLRKARKRLKGPSVRDEHTKVYFIEQLDRILKERE